MELLKQQNEAINHLLEWKVGALFMEAGSGKTRVACELVNAVKDVDYILWVGPCQTIHRKDGSSVVEEVLRWGFNCSNVDFVGIETIQSSDRVYLDIYNKVRTANRPFIVVDESLKIKNIEAKRTKRLLELSNYVEYKLILNGTPLSRNLLDIYSQMEFLSPKILNMTPCQYKDTFCNYTTVTKRYGNQRWSKEYIDGYANIDYLHSLIRHYVYECDLNLNISQLYRSIPYFLDEKAKVEYDWYKEHYLDDDVLMMRNNNIFLEMTQKMQHTYCCTDDKFCQIDRLFDEIPQDKTIIFCKYIDSNIACTKRYPRALVLSYQKESYGLNLQGYSHTIYFDKIWDYALRIQSGRRTFRTGQNSNCRYYDLTGNVGLEHLIDKNIEKKINMSEYFKKVSRTQLIKDL